MKNWTPPPGTAGLIFDCDGTLADTMPVHYRAWIRMLNPHGIDFSEERFYALGGMPTERIIPLLAAESGVTLRDVPAMVRSKESLFLDLLGDVRPIEPVVAAAERHRGRMPLAVASGGYRHVIDITLNHLGVRDWFDAIVTAEDTPRHKPDPDVFLEAARRLRLPAAACVVFEDTDIGVEAARRAGAIEVVDVRHWR
jgi:HAD superfamily hydrolase (TIGR01509 family)